MSPIALAHLEGDRSAHIETRRLQLKSLQHQMQRIKIAFLADISLWLLDEHDASLQSLIGCNLEYAQAMGAHLSEFKAAVAAFESTFLPQTQEWFHDLSFWWHHDSDSVLYARSHFGSQTHTLYTIREVIDAPFRHLTDSIAQKQRQLIRKYHFPSLPEREFAPILSQAPDSIVALLDEYDELLIPGRRLVAQINVLESLERHEQSQTLWKNA